MFRSLVCFLALSPFLFSASISHGAVVGEWTFDEYLPTDGILPLNFRHADTSGNGRDMRNLDQILTFSQSFSAGAPQYGGGTAIQFTGNELIGSGYLELLTGFSGFVNLAGSPDGGPVAGTEVDFAVQNASPEYPQPPRNILGGDIPCPMCVSESYTVWRDSLGQTVTPGTAADGIIDDLDYAFWKTNFQAGLGAVRGGSAIPEPTGLVLLLAGLTAALCRRKQD